MSETVLDNWIAYGGSPFVRGGGASLRLHLMGDGTGHPNPDIADGEPIRTSPIMSWQGRTVKTRNTTYMLGGMAD